MNKNFNLNKNQSPIISVIMPVYNVEEKYLRQAVECVLNQSYTDFEFIIVNDNSPDNSEEVILSYKDERIKYFRSESQQGQSIARNIALKAAVGKYIFYIDSDDWIELNTFEKLIEQAEKQDFDILFFGTHTYDNVTGEIDNWMNDLDFFPDGEFEQKFLYSVIIENIFAISNSCWGKLFNREFLIKNNLFFVGGLIFEDTEFFFRYTLAANKIIVMKEYFYFYRRWIENSTISCCDGRYLDTVKIFELIENTLRQYNLFESLKFKFYNFKFGVFRLRYKRIMPEYKEKFNQLIKEDFKKIRLTQKEFNKIKGFNPFLDDFLDEFLDPSCIV